MNKITVIVGGGGHANAIYSLLLKAGEEVYGIVSQQPVHKNLLHLKRFKSDNELINKFSAESIVLVNGIGLMPFIMKGASVFKKYRKLGYKFQSVISSDAIVDKSAQLNSGCIVMAGAIVQSSAVIGMNCLVNSGAIIEHDCKISSHSHVAPGAIICGGVTIGRESFVGAGATIIESVSIGNNVVVGAGASVIRSLPSRTFYLSPSRFNKIIK